MYRLITFFTFERLVVLFAVCVVAFFALTFTVGFQWSWILLLIIIGLFLRYIFFGTVGAAARKMQTQDFDGAMKMLGYTWKPEWLKLNMHGMYYYLKGSIQIQQKDLNAGEKNMLKAVDLGLPDNDSYVMAYVNLSAMYLNRGRKNEAKEFHQKAKKLKPTNPMILDALKQIDQALNAPKVTMQQQFMMRGRGGFRKI